MPHPPSRLRLNLLSGILVPAAAAVLLAGPAAGESPTLPTAEEVVARVNARPDGATLSRSLAMELTSARGKVLTRKARVFRKDVEGTRKLALFYTAPGDLDGTAYLDVGLSYGKHRRWLYEPAERRVTRIPIAARGHAFTGTDFTHEDLERGTKLRGEDYRAEMLGAEPLDGKPCFKIALIPRTPEIAEELGHGRSVVWVDSEIWFPRRIEVMDGAGEPLRTLAFGDVREVSGFWTAHQLTAEDHRTGHRTRFTYTDVDYTTAIDDDRFTRRALERGL